jgi:hypothetical protein
MSLTAVINLRYEHDRARNLDLFCARSFVRHPRSKKAGRPSGYSTEDGVDDAKFSEITFVSLENFEDSGDADWVIERKFTITVDSIFAQTSKPIGINS